MDGLAWVDELYAAFAETLPEPLDEVARGLAHALGLTPSRDIRWSEVFGHEVTLGAPGLIADAMPDVDPGVVRDAVTAHMLAVIEAFASDRIEDGQVSATPELSAVLEHARRARNAAVAHVAPGVRDPAIDFALAERRTMKAIEDERAIFRRGETVGFERYLDVAIDKQQLGLPASVALAHAAGWDERRRQAVKATLEAVAMGLQLHDDVVDWGDDLTRGGAWAAALAADMAAHQAPRDRRTVPLSVKRMVQSSGVLSMMLVESARQFRMARRRAAALGCGRLGEWAHAREVYVGELSLREADAPGYTERAKALSSWARTVLV